MAAAGGIVLLGLCMGCQTSKARLRIANEGSAPFENLTVMFPKDQIGFGHVPAGATTDYREVAQGVGRDASFRFVVNGQPTEQFVVDFVGWKPVNGKRVHIPRSHRAWTIPTIPSSAEHSKGRVEV